MADNIDSKKMPKSLQIGDRIRCKNNRDLRHTAFVLSSDGYGIAILGYCDLMDYVLTITELPDNECFLFIWER